MNWTDAWSEICRRWLPDDPVRPSADYENQYHAKWDAVRQVQPKVIAEIGVRAGYSALAMLLAAPAARYIGFEADRGNFGGEVGLTRRAIPSVLAGFAHEVRYVDSQTLSRIDEPVDLFHVDGDHSYDGTAHDLELAWGCAAVVLVDDYDYIRAVQAATDHFIVVHRLVYPFCQMLSDGGFRGSMMLLGSRHPQLAGRVHTGNA